MRRRNALWLAGAAAGAVAVSRLGGPALDAAQSILPGLAIDFDPAPVPGYRIARLGAQSGGLDPFAGLGATQTSQPPAPVAPERVGSIRDDGAGPQAVVFTDFRCPHCRTLETALEAMDVAFLRREWPLFGPSSDIAARAALAAAAQGRGPEMIARLRRTSFAPTEAWLRAVAGEEGLDADRLLADMAGPAVAGELAETAALARLFALRGTPTMFYGRTILEGVAPRSALRRLMDRERRDHFAGS